MKDIGTYLKEQRIRCELSMKDVFEQTGITDSKLSRQERGSKMLTPDELKKLAVLYHVNAVPLFVMAGYLDETDLEDYQMGFQRAGLLNNAERECIQAQTGRSSDCFSAWRIVLRAGRPCMGSYPRIHQRSQLSNCPCMGK